MNVKDTLARSNNSENSLLLVLVSQSHEVLISGLLAKSSGMKQDKCRCAKEKGGKTGNRTATEESFWLASKLSDLQKDTRSTAAAAWTNKKRERRGPRDVLAATSRSPHWPGMANHGQWELQSVEPEDTAGKQTLPAHQWISLTGHVPKIADPWSMALIMLPLTTIRTGLGLNRASHGE
ncbi:unnamed protein product [Natator depressus]